MPNTPTLGDLKGPVDLWVTPANYDQLQRALQVYLVQLRMALAEEAEAQMQEDFARLIREMERLSNDLGNQALPQIEAQRKAYTGEGQ